MSSSTISGRLLLMVLLHCLSFLILTRAEPASFFGNAEGPTGENENGVMNISSNDSMLSNDSSKPVVLIVKTFHIVPIHGEEPLGFPFVLPPPLDLDSSAEGTPMDKLKSAVNNAGISGEQANRVVRAVMGMNMSEFAHHKNNETMMMEEFNRTARHVDFSVVPNSMNMTMMAHNETDDAFNRTARNFIPEPEIGGFRLFSTVINCGFEPKTDRADDNRFEQPWMASLMSADRRSFCSGALLSESIVVTTASCVDKLRLNQNNQPIIAVLGSHSEPHTPDGLAALETFTSSAVIHPSHRAASGPGSGDSDIALLRLSQNVPFDMYRQIFPICVADDALRKQAGERNCQVTSFTPNRQFGTGSRVLTTTPVTVSSSNCQDQMSKSCATGANMNAREGDIIFCKADTGRSYIWGLALKTAQSTVSVVSLVDNYQFIAQYLWTTNPNAA